MGTRVVIEIADETHEALSRISERTQQPLEVIAQDAIRDLVAREQDLLDAVRNGGEALRSPEISESDLDIRRRAVTEWLDGMARLSEGRFMEEGRDQPPMPPPPPDIWP